MITEDYVSSETAKLLKEKGFDEPCYRCFRYSDDSLQFYGNEKACKNSEAFATSAPTLQMVMKWLREEKGIAVIPVLSSVLDNEKFLWDIKIVVAETYDTYSQGWVYEKLEAECDAAIKYCLENLI